MTHKLHPQTSIISWTFNHKIYSHMSCVFSRVFPALMEKMANPDSLAPLAFPDHLDSEE